MDTDTYYSYLQQKNTNERLEKLEKKPVTRVSKKSEFNKSDFTLIQTGLLILYLKEKKVFLSELSDKVIYECFETLTGFSKNQLKKIISGKPKHDKTELTQKKEDYNKLKSLLVDIDKQIEKELSKLK